MGKGENAGEEHFLHFPQCFFFFNRHKTNINFSVTFILLSANAFHLDQSKILSFGNEFTFYSIDTHFNASTTDSF